jgi:hypothetical protein
MPKLEWDLHSDLPPERILDALTDFTETRPDQWAGLARELYEVYEVGPTSAIVKEGTKGPPKTVWAREAYDWSTPGTVSWIVQESNFAEPGYGVTATVTPSNGGSTVHVSWERVGTTFGSRLLITMLAARNGAMIKKFVQKSFDSIPKEPPLRA